MSSMRDRGIVLDPYLDHGVLVRVCQEVGVPIEELDPSSVRPAEVSCFGRIRRRYCFVCFSALKPFIPTRYTTAALVQ